MVSAKSGLGSHQQRCTKHTAKCHQLTPVIRAVFWAVECRGATPRASAVIVIEAHLALAARARFARILCCAVRTGAGDGLVPIVTLAGAATTASVVTACVAGCA